MVMDPLHLTLVCHSSSPPPLPHPQLPRWSLWPFWRSMVSPSNPFFGHLLCAKHFRADGGDPWIKMSPWPQSTYLPITFSPQVPLPPYTPSPGTWNWPPARLFSNLALTEVLSQSDSTHLSLLPHLPCVHISLQVHTCQLPCSVARFGDRDHCETPGCPQCPLGAHWTSLVHWPVAPCIHTFLFCLAPHFPLANSLPLQALPPPKLTTLLCFLTRYFCLWCQ